VLHWAKQIGIHNFELTLLQSVEKQESWSTLNTNENFSPNQNLQFNALQFGNNPSLSNNDEKATGDALMGRLNYSLLNKYLLTLSVRRDGYSAFGQKNNPRATFPAIAFAWKVSDEKFFNLNWVDQMKLRLSWGANGNRDIGAYSALARVSPNLYYDGSNAVMGVTTTSIANPDLAWEQTEAYNAGLDLEFFKGRITLNANYYDMTTTNLLMNRILPAITGFNSITVNLGEVKNRGMDLTLSTINMNKSNFRWKSNFVFSFNRNRIVRLFGDYKEVTIDGKTVKQEVPDIINGWFPGHAIDAVWNYKVTGVWQVNETAQAADYNMVPGDFKAQDVNQDTSYQALDDKQFLGYLTPRYRLGLRNDFTVFKNFLVSFFVRADIGEYLGAYAASLDPAYSQHDRENRLANIPYWTPANPINDYARLGVNTSAYGGGLMLYKPRSFVRIQDFSLAYSIPSITTERAKLSGARIFASVHNIYSFTKWPGWDPESMNFPMPRTYTIGMHISF
jgi:TonB-dependent starch-binding outer membrane protein SusC